MPAAQTITPGDRFGRWTVLQAIKINPRGTQVLFRECRCNCGTIQFVNIYKLRSGHSQSCGCLQAHVTSLRSLIHGHAKADTRVYRIWTCIITRCTNPKATNFERYGGRGITVCERWRQFENFLEDMGEPPEGLSIDRLDNDGNYEKENCAWRDAKAQSLNRRPRQKKPNS